MGWEAYFVGGLIVTMLAVLATGRFSTDWVMIAVLTILVAMGIVDTTDAFKGFANSGLVTVAFLYVVAAGLQETGAMSLVTSRLLGMPKTAMQAQARMIFPVAGLSAFMNNTPLVAMFIPALRELARRSGIPASQVMMPLSFAAILGGVCTLIGTSTNLVVFSMIEGHNTKVGPEAAVPQMTMWTITAVGLPVAILGGVYMLAFGRKLLRAKSDSASADASSRAYTAAMQVTKGSALAGKSIERAGLRHLPGLYLARIERATESIIAVDPSTELQEGDVLVFVGDLASMVDVQKIAGLSPVTDEGAIEHGREKRKLMEAVVSSQSRLVGRTVRDAEIRTRYGAVVVAVHRLGHQLKGRIGDLRLRAGDTLLLEADRSVGQRIRQSTEFYLVSELEGAAAPRHRRAWAALAILAGLVFVMSFSDMPVVRDLPIIGGMSEAVAAMCAACGMILLRCCTGGQARAGIEWPVLVVIGTSFGLGKAMESTGLAKAVADLVSSVASPLGPWGLIGAVYLLTLGFTTLISNNAAAALMFPIAMGMSSQTGTPFMGYAIAICLGASCEFMTPLGYQTNLMVMRPGGYTWGDFFRFGAPLTLLTAVVSIALIPIVFGMV